MNLNLELRLCLLCLCNTRFPVSKLLLHFILQDILFLGSNILIKMIYRIFPRTYFYGDVTIQNSQKTSEQTS